MKKKMICRYLGDKKASADIYRAEESVVCQPAENDGNKTGNMA